MTLPVPENVVVVEAAPSSEAALALLEEERALTASFVDKRLRDFATGRKCAREALAQLGADVTPLLIGDGREPKFPDGFVGSISHTSGTCAAAVARAADYRSIGIDIEQARALKPEVAKRIASEKELSQLPPADAFAMAMILFSAKEAFYKLQYPLTGKRLGFRDVRIALSGAEFEVELLRNAGEFRSGDRFKGRYLRSSDYISTALVLP